jgi:hypothetical protein
VAIAMGTSIRRAVDAVGTSYRCVILATAASTLDSTLTARSGIMDTADVVGTSNRRVVDAMRNTANGMGTSSSRRVRSGIIYIFSNYRLRINFLSISCNSS